MEHLSSLLVLAQSAPVGFDPSSLLQQGPLGVAVVGLLWYIGKLNDKIDHLIDTHKVEIAAERSLNAQQQDQRINDQKVLIPLATSMVASNEQTRELLSRMTQK